MKKIYKESQHEIRRLKLENQEILNALEACKQSFETGSALRMESLQNKIDHLETENDKLNEENELYQKMLSETGPKEISPLLEHERNQIKNYKTKFFSCLQQKSLLEENLSQSQQENARLQLDILELKTKLRAEKSLREKLEKESPKSETTKPHTIPKLADWREVVKMEDKKPPVPLHRPPLPFSIKNDREIPLKHETTNKENIVGKANNPAPICQPQYRDIKVQATEKRDSVVKEKTKDGAAKVTNGSVKLKSGFSVKTIKIQSKKKSPTASLN